MPTFQYEAMNAAGQEVKDEVEANSTEEAITKIRNQGYFPTKVRPKGGKKQAAAAAAGPSKRRPGGSVGTKQLTQFTRQLSTLMDAGLPILRSIRILEQQQKPGNLRVCLRHIAEDVEGGATLSEAMARNPKAFDRLFTNMIAAGEAGGVLDVILQRLAEFMEKTQKLKRKVIGAMIYPAAVVSFALLIVSGIMYYVVPKFKTIFGDFGTELPGPTKFLLAASDWMIGRREVPGAKDVYENMWLPGVVWMLGSPFMVWLVIWVIKKFKGGKYAVDVVKLKIPILGAILAKTAVARFTRTLGTLISAGVPILEAITITKDTSGNEVFVQALGRVHDSIREGDSFANPLRASKVVDGIVVNMVDVGEETGDLDKMLIKVADNYDDEVETMVAGLVSLLEPIMVIFLGVIIGFIVISLFLPLVSLINNLTGGG